MKHYPHHIGDFDRATRHLTRLERSVYRDLLDLYYDTEAPLTLDRKALCRRILATSNDESTAVEQVLNEFFIETNTGWFNERCDEEIEAYRANSSQKALAGKASAAAKAAKKQQMLNDRSTAVETPLQRNENGDTTASQLTNQPINQSTNKPPKPPSADFERFWVAYPKKVSKPAALRSWQKINPDDDLTQRMLAAIANARASPDWRKDQGKFIPHPATWLTGERWLDELPAATPSRGTANWWTEAGFGSEQAAKQAGEKEPVIA